MYHNPPFPVQTQAVIREAFWRIHEGVYKRKGRQKQNEYSCEIRTAWNDFVDMLKKTNQISEKLASRATL